MVETKFFLDVAGAWPHRVKGQAFRLDPGSELALAGDDGEVAPGAQLKRYGYERIEVSRGAAGRKYDLSS